MSEEIKDDIQETPVTDDDVREEDTKDEIRDETYVNDDEVEMLRSLENKMNEMFDKFDSYSEKIENAISMMVDSGAIVSEIDAAESKDDYEEDFIDIDEMDLSL